MTPFRTSECSALKCSLIVFKLKLDYCTDSKDCFLFLKTVNSLTTVNEYLFKSFPVIALLIQKKNNKQQDFHVNTNLCPHKSDNSFVRPRTHVTKSDLTECLQRFAGLILGKVPFIDLNLQSWLVDGTTSMRIIFFFRSCGTKISSAGKEPLGLL